MRTMTLLIIMVLAGGIFSGCLDVKKKGKEFGASFMASGLDKLEKKVSAVDENSKFGRLLTGILGLISLVSTGVYTYKKTKKDVHRERNVGRKEIQELLPGDANKKMELPG